MTTLKIEIAGEDDKAAFKQLKALYELIGATMPDENGNYILAPGYSHSDIYGSSVCEVVHSENSVDRTPI